ncbi:multidrug effflux MFS transporter [uncultured Jannaschia sp.]|uniref:multidrug effflux MFS transporter n=1 Tax=uncultured Jannaschia sp. TaxID=293347 RepID=UPI0026039342|nr:multidrug effflux MFS transporter [uncultured Jannaschia sp.]
MSAPPDAPVRAVAPERARALSEVEFIALMAMLVATIAFSIDSMLPALPEIGRQLSPGSANAAQLVIVAFVFGMGLGTLFVGPMSDALGRKNVMLGGAILYCVGALAASVAPSLETLLLARVVQGLGASGPRVAAQAMIRDLYAGRGMARISSFVMMTFTLVPAFAPLIGSLVIDVAGWRGLFAAFVLFSAVTSAWLALRQPETLPRAMRRPMRLTPLRLSCREVLAHPNVRRSILMQTLIFGVLFGTITSVQQVYDISFHRAESFPVWFCIVALISGAASFVNARLVMRLGMLWLLRRALTVHLVLSVGLLAVWMLDVLPADALFAVFLLWQIGTFAMAGLTIGNLNAVAMQPMGHIAGMASSVIAAVSTVLAVVVAAAIGLSFDGTPVPLATGAVICIALALLLSRRLQEEPMDSPSEGRAPH